AKRFFDLPLEVKQMIRHPPSADDHRGYAEVGLGTVTQGIWDPSEVQKLKDTLPVEQKEVLEAGNPYSEDDRSKNPYPNRFLPEHVFPGFRAFYKNFWDACVEQEQQVLRCLCEILGMPDVEFLNKQQTRDANRGHLALLHYLSQPLSPLKSGQANRLNDHTDYGQITLLIQDMVGGLEIYDYEDQKYRPMVPKPGTVIIQVADMLEKQSNGRWKSALHHVTAPSAAMYNDSLEMEDAVIDRYSLVFFVQPDFHTMVEPLPGCENIGKWRTFQWEPNTTAGEWTLKRIRLEYEQHQEPSEVSVTT
ncbi:MAG: hypothetical protein LQ351_001199, partial [Letrouitia transgressa]